jgi:hypothetical protein
MGFAANQQKSFITPANQGDFPTFEQLDAAPTYASQFSGGKTYGLTFNVGGQEYSYVPDNIANNGGLTAGDNTYLLPYFTDQKNVDQFNQNSKNLDLTGTSLDSYLKSQGLSTSGYLVPYNKAVYDSNVNPVPTSTLGGDLVGLKREDGNIVYGLSGGSGARYSTTTGEVHDPKVTYSSSILDNILSGNIGGALQGIVDHAGDFAAIAAGYYGGAAIADALGPALTQAMGGTSIADLPPVPTTLPSFGEGVQVASNAPTLPALTPASALPSVAPAVTEATTAQTIADLTPYVAPAAVGTALSGLASGGAAPATVGSTLGPVTSTLAPATTGSTLGQLGSGTLATPGDLGTNFVTQGAANPVSTIGQGATLSAPATAGTGAIGSGLGGAATDSYGNIIPAIGGAGAGSATAAIASGLTPTTSISDYLSSLVPSTVGGQIAAVQGLTGLGSALIGANASQNAANIQSAAAQGASQLQGQMFNTINQQQAPYRTAGYNALNQLGGLGSGTYQMFDAAGNPTTMGTGTGYLTKQFGPADLAAGLAPNYDFMLQQGQMANQRAANVAGGGLGGNALQGLQNYTQNYAGNAYQNAFNNYQSQRTGIYNTLAGIAGIGQTGQSQTNTAATNLANAQSQLGVGSAAAQAAGQVGTAGAYGTALGTLGSGLTLASLLNQRGNVTQPLAA